MEKKSLKEVVIAGQIDQLLPLQRAQLLADRIGQEVLTNEGWPVEKTGHELGFKITSATLPMVADVVVARPGKFPVRAPTTYKVVWKA